MPALNHFLGSRPIEYVVAALSDDGGVNAAAVAAAAATLDETESFLWTVAGLYAFDGTDLGRLRSMATNADNIAVLTTGALATASHLFVWDAAGGNWDRWDGGIVAGAAAGMADDSAFTIGTSEVEPTGWLADDTAPDSVDENDIGIPRMTLTRVPNFVATDPVTITQRQRVLAAGATLDETAAQFATTSAAMYGWDGADLSRVLVESAAAPNLRTGIFDGAAGPADVAAAAATLDETAATFLKTMGAIYAQGSADLERIGTASNGIAALADTIGTGILAGVLMGVFDDTGPAATTENQFGALRMTTTRVLNTVASDPTTPTQRQRVLAATATQDETATQYAATLAAMYGMGTADLERLITGSVGIATLADTAGTGILANILMAVFDDTGPVSSTENQFGAIRMGADRILYMGGSVAADLAYSGRPVPLGAWGSTVTPTAMSTDGDMTRLWSDLNGRLVVTLGTALDDDTDSISNIFRPVAAPPATPSTHQDAGTATTLNVKATAGSVYSIRVTNINAAIRYFQLHNTATTPAGAAVPQMWFPVPAGTATQPAVLELSLDWFAPAERFATGIAWAWSTTAATYTAATAGDHATQVRYV